MADAARPTTGGLLSLHFLVRIHPVSHSRLATEHLK
jgi:hypothetical protein